MSKKPDTPDYGRVVGEEPKRMMNDVDTWFDPVYDIDMFHKKFKQNYDGPPAALPPETQEFRLKFLHEELKEYEDAVDQLTQYGESPERLENAFDALIDLVYVTLGTAHLHGFDFRNGWRRVHRANMGKVLAGDAGLSKRGYALDVVKPAGWTPPNLKDLCGG